jgi:MFS family permease
VSHGTAAAADPPSGGAAVLARCVLVAMACGSPLALVSGFGPAILRDLGLSTTAVGAAASAFFVATAVVAFPAGRWIDRSSADVGLRLAAGTATVGLVVGAMAGGQAGLAVALGIAGAALGIAMPACARAMTQALRPDRLGTSMGLLHAAIPTAVMLASAAVALLAVVNAWRTAFLVCATGGLALGMLPTSRVDSTRSWATTGHPHVDGRKAPHGGLVALFLAVTLASTAAGVLLTSFVVSTTSLGLSTSVAASVLATGTFASVIVRVVGGWAADRVGSVGAVPAGVLLGLGGVGALFVAGETSALVLGAALALGAGLGWPGLLYSAVARRSVGRAGAAIGAIEFGASGGAALGPTLFGLLLDGRGAPTAWYFVAGCLLIAALCSFVGDLGGRSRATVTPA